MQGFAINNAPTDHGGFIPATQSRDFQMGNAFVRAGDGHFCPKCKCWSTVVKSHDHVIIDGKAVAYVGDKLTCGARIQPQQSHVVGNSQGQNYQSSSSHIFKPINSQENLTSNFAEKEAYKFFYVENYKTNIFIQHRAVIQPSEKDSKAVSLLQMVTGAVSYFLNYKITGNSLFISVSIYAHPLSNDAKVYPFGAVVVSRENKVYSTTQLKQESGIWNTEGKKSPVGSCTITLPSPNLQVVKVEVTLGYKAQYNDTVGYKHPMPPKVSYEFSISSFAKRI